MREIRQSGSEGGGAREGSPYPYRDRKRCPESCQNSDMPPIPALAQRKRLSIVARAAKLQGWCCHSRFR